MIASRCADWNLFVGGGAFCLKLCDNSITSPDYCQNKFDLIGCEYNMPSANKDGEFTKCDGDLQDPAGVYTGTDGKTTTWVQPTDTLPAGYVMPYTPRVPASSNCVTYQSTDLFKAGATATASGKNSTSTSTTGSNTASSAIATGKTTGASSGSGASAEAAKSTGASTTPSAARGQVDLIGGAAFTLALGAAVLVALFALVA